MFAAIIILIHRQEKNSTYEQVKLGLWISKLHLHKEQVDDLFLKFLSFAL